MMAKRQAKVDPSILKEKILLRNNLSQRIASTVTLIMSMGENKALSKTLDALKAADDANDGFAYADAIEMLNKSHGFVKTGDGEFRLL